MNLCIKNTVYTFGCYNWERYNDTEKGYKLSKPV